MKLHRAHRLGVLEVRVDRCDHDACFNGDQVDANERDPDPGVDDDTFIQDPVEYVDQTAAARGAFDCHSLPAFPLLRLTLR